MNYFEFYDIPVSFTIDAKQLKKTFLLNSKKYHPDFHTDKSEEEQNKILELSSLNNEAYTTLSDFYKRMKYILDIHNLLEEGKDKVPQDFLMEMMDINEALMELEFDSNDEQTQNIQNQVETLKKSMIEELNPIINNYNNQDDNEKSLQLVKNFYLKHQYILRIQNNLDKFASAS